MAFDSRDFSEQKSLSISAGIGWQSMGASNIPLSIIMFRNTEACGINGCTVVVKKRLNTGTFF